MKHPMDQNGKHFYDFGPFRLKVTQRVLVRDGHPVPLGAKAFEVLRVLVENRGQVVTRDELRELVWPTTPINESSVNQQIRNIRRALGDNGRAPATQYIQTISGEGYSFVADVTERRENLPAGATKPPTQIPALKLRRLAWVILPIGGLGGLVAWLVADRLQPSPIRSPVQVGRLLARSTSEGRSPTRIRLSHAGGYLALSPDGRKLFITSYLPGGSRTLSILNTVNETVRTVSLPTDANSLAVSPDGKLYIGSQADGIIVFDITSEKLLPGLVRTHGPVRDMAITPDGKKLFLAMSQFGVKRLLIRTGELKQVTDQVCPEHLALDRSGRRLYVSYQCGGPGGRRGHDSLEIFDAEREETLGVFSGPPMVGGSPSVSPDGQLATLDGTDACSIPTYDHIGCPLVPSNTYFLFRPGDRQVLRSFPRPVPNAGPAPFVDSSRFLVLGTSVTVMDVTSGTIRENWEHGFGGYYRAIFTPDGRRAFLGGHHDILMLETEDQGCSPPQIGLEQFYSGDGTMEDTAAVTELTPRGDVSFVPGKIGQAFFFNGTGFLDGPRTANYSFGVLDSTLALYVKFASLEGEMTLLERMTTAKDKGFAVLKSEDNRFFLEVVTTNGLVRLASKNRATENHWYHLAIAKNDRGLALYVDGVLEDQRFLNSPPYFLTGGDLLHRLHIGAGDGGRLPLRGWLDEIAFYDRALSPGEVKALYQLRESGPCKL
jgi:DNA-binding winged helix-turn-helix (wHTH) protein/DNA-binding beta-propeller fold protein YncE